MNRLSPEKQADILNDMMERKSMRGLARTARGNSRSRRKGVSINTVIKLLRDAGDAAKDFHDAKVRKIKARFVEADEVYAIVKLRPGTLRDRGLRIPGLGAVWIWVAIEAESKLVICWHVGGRTREDAMAFMHDLSSRVDGVIQLTTDSLMAYPDAVADAFAEIHYATVKKRSAEEEQLRMEAELSGKTYRSPRKRRGDPQQPKDPPYHHLGDPDDARATTNHIESFFTQLRKDLARMTRRSTMISKNIENLRRMVSLYMFHHNFVKKHSSLGNKTPAMKAGVDDSAWEWDDFIIFIDELWKKRREQRKKDDELPAQVSEDQDHPLTPQGDLPFCLFHSFSQKTAKVHKADCRHLRATPDREGKKGLGEKIYYGTKEEAEAAGEAFAPRRVTVCKVCLGNYNAKEYLGPRGPTKRR